MFKNKARKLIIFLIVIGLFAIFNHVFAQNFGTNELSNGLNNSLSTADPRQTAGRIINIVLGLLGVIAVGIIMWGGFVWLMSNGEEEKIETAKKILKNGVIGLVIILSAWGITLFILNKLGGAINGGSNPGLCANGASRSCGLGGCGSMSCSNGSWGNCFPGSDCCVGPNCVDPVGCDSDNNPNTGCQATNQVCAPGDYCDATSCNCKPQGGPGDSCDSDKTNGNKCDADNNLCGEYLSCSTDTCVCFGPPVITSISPVGGFCQDNPNKSCSKEANSCGTTCNFTTPNGAPDNFITIYGKSFGTYSSSTSKVIFEGTGNPVNGKQPTELNPACVSFWQDNEIIIAVPNGASSGPIKVINKDNLSDETNNSYGPKIDDFLVNNIVRPGLCSLTPNQGVLSDQVNYQGFNLFSGNAYFGNYQSNVQGNYSNFPNQLSGSTSIPNILPGDSGSFVISNLNGKQPSNSLLFTKNQEAGAIPYIISFWPLEGNAGQYVTIRGSGFGSAQGTSKVFFGDTEASYNFPDICLRSVWRDNQIIVKVPSGLASAAYTIKIKLGTLIIDSSKITPSSITSNTFRSDTNLSLLTSICNIEPDNGPIATPVNIWGEYFGNDKSEVSVKFSSASAITGIVAKDEKGQADLIKTAVPPQTVTGPVKVIKNNSSGNEVNFTVGSCAVDADCGATQVCCPAGTYREGRCFASLDLCSSDIPTSVYEWRFSTSFNIVDPYYSCAAMSQKLNSCQVGATCPNAPGTCSPYAGGKEITGKDCDFSCAAVPGCSVLGTNICSYDKATNKCIKNGTNGFCDLIKTAVYQVGGEKKELSNTCNQDGKWELTTNGACPTYIINASGTPVRITLTPASGKRCIDLNSACSSCETGLTCETQSDGKNKCASTNLICPIGSECKKNNDSSGTGKCISKDEGSCGCCCTIGQDTRDCCSYKTASGTLGQLTCGGTCGADTGRTGTTADPITLGKCGGCAAAGASAPERDAACNCTGHSGQYCDVSDANPQGVCSDCTSLSNKTNCDDHSAACCFDANKSDISTDDFCRGGDSIKTSNDASAIGYCAYYNCQSKPAGDPKLCATSTPVKLGVFNTIDKCTSTSTGCFVNPGDNYCSLSDGKIGECSAKIGCCFDAKSSDCQSGSKLSIEPNMGYCAYYDCQSASSKPPGNPKLCNLTASSTGAFMSTSTCSLECANEKGGAGESCAGETAIPVAGQSPASICDFNSCSFPGLQCLTSAGAPGLLPDCGSCCCTPSSDPTKDFCITNLTPNLHCQQDKGNCSGAGRGLCCGCSKDSDCGSTGTTGCGADSCCEARPKIATTSPVHLATAVCRNTVIKVAFNQLMDIASSNNLILLEEKDSGSYCQSGYLANNSVQDLLNNQPATVLARIYNSLSSFWHKIISRLGGQALADVPDSKKVYCLVPGNVKNEEQAGKSTLIFSPTKILNPKANYYIIVQGDENLNSQSGVLSLSGIGFNGEGYPDGDSYIEGEALDINGLPLLKFNNNVYKNSRISKFTTMSGDNSICKISYVSINPDSYLFATTANDLKENDTNPLDKNTFDSVADKDKVFTAQAYSTDGQMLQPVTNYFWDWNWQIENPQVATTSPVVGLENNKVFVSAVAGVTDDSTKLKAIINMNRFQKNNSCVSDINCECSGSNCSNNCCNDYTTDGLISHSSDLYVFVCQNPWPPVASDGSWKPWSDNGTNCQNQIGCSDFNYKFYYCRDAGDSTTLDDLPAIINQAVTMGQSPSLICSSDHSICSGPNTPCGPDNDGNGSGDGVCLWNVLKESYFFREAGTQGGQIDSADNTLAGDSVKVTWRSAAADVGSYIIYYSKSGSSYLPKTVPLSACTKTATIYNCTDTVSGLSTGVSYNFKVSAISINKVETPLLGEKSAKPSDTTPPPAPTGLKAELKNNKIVFSWLANNDKTSGYYLYHGVNPSIYGERIPSASVIKAISTGIDISKFGLGNHYFALSAIDASNNESGKSVEINFKETACQSTNGMTMRTYTGTGAKPTAIAFDGKNMWTADFAGKSVTKITPQGVMSIYSNLVQNPSSIAYDGKNMWVTNLFSNSVSVISSTGVGLIYDNIGQQPRGIAYDGKNMWTANYGDSSVSKINPAGKSIVYPIGGNNNNPSAIAYDGVNMWTANASNSVTKITPSGKATTFVGTGSSSVAIIYDGTNMWTANSGDNSVSKVDPAGVITTYKNIGSNPRGIAYDGTYIWVANSTGDSMTRVTSSGEAVTYIGTGSGPNAIAYDGKNMWTTNYNSNSVTNIFPVDPSCIDFDFSS